MSSKNANNNNNNNANGAKDYDTLLKIVLIGDSGQIFEILNYLILI